MELNCTDVLTDRLNTYITPDLINGASCKN